MSIDLEKQLLKSPSPDQRGKLKTAKLPVKVIPMEGKPPRKPAWIKTKIPLGQEVSKLKKLLRKKCLTYCLRRSVLPQSRGMLSHGTATFMIMGDICTRRCPFCDVAHGRPKPLDSEEPKNLAKTVEQMGLKYIVITSVDRDDLKDAGAGHFVACIAAFKGANVASQDRDTGTRFSQADGNCITENCGLPT